MLRDEQKELLRRLDLPYPCVAIKFRFENPTCPITMGKRWPIAST